MEVPDFAHWHPDSRLSIFANLEEKSFYQESFDPLNEDRDNWIATALRYVSMDGREDGEEFEIFGSKVPLIKVWQGNFAVLVYGSWKAFPKLSHKLAFAPVAKSDNPGRVAAIIIRVYHRETDKKEVEVVVARPEVQD